MLRLWKTLTFVSIPVMLAGTIASAGQETLVVPGYTDAPGAPTTIAFSPIVNGAYTVEKGGLVAVFESPYPGARDLPDPARPGKTVSVLEQRAAPEKFEGASYYAMPLGHRWRGGSTAIDAVNLTKATAQGRVQGGKVTLHFRAEPQQDGESTWLPITWITVMPDGRRAWGGHPGYPRGPYIAYNKNRQPLTIWGEDAQGGKILPPTEAVRQLMAARE